MGEEFVERCRVNALRAKSVGCPGGGGGKRLRAGKYTTRVTLLPSEGYGAARGMVTWGECAGRCRMNEVCVRGRCRSVEVHDAR